MQNKAIFFDRDGVLVKTRVYKNKPYAALTLDKFYILKSAKKVVSKLKEAGYKTIVVTNQPEISTGRLNPKTLQKMHDLLKNELLVDDVYHCPHTDTDQCNCRKPKTGMLDDASVKHSIDPSLSFMIGDLHKDISAGKSKGCKTILIKRSYSGDCIPDFEVKKLTDIIDIILK